MQILNHRNGYAILPLGNAPKGFKGTIASIDASPCTGTCLDTSEIECRLIEMGFTEGAIIEIKHEGLFGSDPIAVRVNNMTIALRRREANAINVTPLEAHA